MSELTQERLKEVLHYDPLTGLLTRVVAAGSAKVGDIAGTITTNRDGKRYRHIKLDSKSHLAHRLACLYMEGKFPLAQIDHEDGDGTNNIWTNLRHATNQENGKNQRLYATNTSGHVGVRWHKQAKWCT